MKIVFTITITVLSLAALCNMAYAESAFEMAGSGAAVINNNNPKMYQSIFRMTLSNQSTIAKGTFLVYGRGNFF